MNRHESLAPIEKVRESFPPWLLLLANRDFRQGLTLGDSHTVVSLILRLLLTFPIVHNPSYPNAMHTRTEVAV